MRKLLSWSEDTMFLVVALAVFVGGCVAAYFFADAKATHLAAIASNADVATARSSPCMESQMKAQLGKGRPLTNEDLLDYGIACRNAATALQKAEQRLAATKLQAEVLP